MRRLPAMLRHPVELGFVLRAAATATATELVLSVTGLPRALRLLTAGVSPLPVPPEARRAELTDRLLRLNRGPLQPNCVLRSVILARYRDRGAASTAIVFGVRPGQHGAFDGHAWLEREGEPILEKTDPRPLYTETWRRAFE